jgi:hypothetical protein
VGQKDGVQSYGTLKVGDRVKFVLYRKGEEKTKLCLPLRGPAKVIKVSESGGAVVLEWTDLATGVTHVLDRNIRYVFTMKEGDKGLENLQRKGIQERYFPDAGPDKQKALLHLQQLRDVSLVDEVEPQSKRPR